MSRRDADELLAPRLPSWRVRGRRRRPGRPARGAVARRRHEVDADRPRDRVRPGRRGDDRRRPRRRPARRRHRRRGGHRPRRHVSGVSWYVDPIDGTTNFVYGLPLWSTSIAAADADGMVVGAVYVPVLGELFAAARGGGATLDGRPIRCSDRADLGARPSSPPGSPTPPARRREQAAIVAEADRRASATSAASARRRSTCATSPPGASTPTTRPASTLGRRRRRADRPRGRAAAPATTAAARRAG